MLISAGQCRQARALLGWSQDDLAAASKVGKATIANFEAGNREPYPRTLDDLSGALESNGIIFGTTRGGTVRMKRDPAPQFNKSEKAAIVIAERARLVGDNLHVPLKDMPFPTFSEAVRYFMTEFDDDQKESAFIVTASNQKWLLEDIEEVFQSPPAALTL